MNNKQQDDMIWAFLEALRIGNAGQAIENQEAKGQSDEAARQTLPREILGGERADFEALGFVFHDNADDLFVHVIFPDGWKKVPTEHSMWTDIVDANGAVRGAIFYKAAFYDRRAHVSLNKHES